MTQHPENPSDAEPGTSGGKTPGNGAPRDSAAEPLSPAHPQPEAPPTQESSPPGEPRPQPRQAPASAPDPAPPERPARRGMRLMLVLLLVVAASAAYGGYWWFFVRGTVSTDDAFIEGRIVSVASRLSERVEEVLVSEGETVKQGQVLVRFDRMQLLLQVRQSEAAVRAARARLAERRNGPRPEEVQVARGEVRVQEVNLELRKKEMRRAERLARVRAISAQEMELRRSALDEAKSQLDVSRSRLALLQAGAREEAVHQAEAELALARARLAATRSELAYTELRAPLDGVLARSMVDPGEVVQKGQTLFQLVEAGRTWIVANLEEDQVTKVRQGQPVRLWIDAYPDREFQGVVGPVYGATVSRFSLLPSSSASGSFIKVTQRVPVRIDWVMNDGATLPPMFPGLNAVVRIDVSGAPAQGATPP